MPFSLCAVSSHSTALPYTGIFLPWTVLLILVVQGSWYFHLNNIVGVWEPLPRSWTSMPIKHISLWSLVHGTKWKQSKSGYFLLYRKSDIWQASGWRFLWVRVVLSTFYRYRTFILQETWGQRVLGIIKWVGFFTREADGSASRGQQEVCVFFSWKSCSSTLGCPNTVLPVITQS